MATAFFEIEHLKRYVEDNPGTILFARLASKLIELGEIDEAIHICKLGLKINPEYAPGYFVLNLALRKQRKKGEASQSLSKAAEFDPNYRYVSVKDFEKTQRTSHSRLVKTKHKPSKKPKISKPPRPAPTLTFNAVNSLKIQCRYNDALEVLAQMQQKKNPNLEKIEQEMQEIKFLQKELEKTDRRLILILGAAKNLKPQIIYGICAEFELGKHEVEMILDYDNIKNYNIRHLQYNEKYTGIVIGPHPHKMRETDNLVKKLQEEEKFPQFALAEDKPGHLKITKTTLRRALTKLLGEATNKKPRPHKKKTPKSINTEPLKATKRIANFTMVENYVKQGLLADALVLLEMMQTKDNTNQEKVQKRIAEIQDLLSEAEK